MKTKWGHTVRTIIADHTNINLGGYINNVEYLVLHFVGASGNAKANANYFRNVYREASAHLFVDPQNTYEVVPLNRVAWHVGDGGGEYGIRNDNAIGVELCQDTTTGKDVWEWDFHAETRKESILVFAYLMEKYNVPINKVVRHYDASRKMCPGNWASNDWYKWKLWKKDLEVYVKTGRLVDSQRNIIYSNLNSTEKQTPMKKLLNKLSVIDVAKQVLRGDWGNGKARKDKLTDAGYNYDEIQEKVQELKSETKKRTIGKYKFLTTVNVRTEPSTRASIRAQYQHGQTVNIESIIEKEGYRWGYYLSYSGVGSYVALGEINGNDYTVKID